MDRRINSMAVVLLLLFIPAMIVFLIITVQNRYYVSSLHNDDPQSVPSKVLDSVSGEYAEAAEEARGLARDLIIEDNLPGVSVAVAIDGGLVWAEGFGWADLGERHTVTPATQFRIGTTTMAFTAAAAGLLYERDLLDLDAPVQEYVPDFPKKQWDITTRQAMGHVAGIRHLRDGMPGLQKEEPFSKTHYDNVLESLAVFADDPVLFEPSTDFSFSAYGWVLVGAAVQAAAGEPYVQFIERGILLPLGMNGTVPGYADEALPDCASFYWPTFYRKTRWGLDIASRVDLSAILPAGGYISTPSDLVKFGIALLDGTLLESGTVEMLRTEQTLTSGETTGYGLGWDIRRITLGDAPDTHLMMSCPGDGVGGTTAFLLFPEERLVVAVVSNVSFATGLEQFAVGVAGLFHQTMR